MKKLSIILATILSMAMLVSCNSTPADGKTPYIQDGYWYIDGVNTGVKAEGVDGEDGKDGEDAVLNAQEDAQGLAFYPQDDGTYVVGGGNAKYMKNLTIPETYRGGDVVAIAENAFKNFTVLEKITIPNSVTKMGKGAFMGCSSLVEISMPCYENTPQFHWLCVDASVDVISSNDEIQIPPIQTIHITGGTAIPTGMFYMYGEAESDFINSLKTLTISDCITSIGEYAFRSCPDSIFEEENGMKYIGKWAVACTNANFSLRDDTIGIAAQAFVPEDGEYDTTITQFAIPSSVRYLSPMALIIPSNISEFKVDSENDYFCAVDGVVYTKDMTTLVQYPWAKEQDSFVCPEQVNKIGGCAFALSPIKSVSLPANITEIADGAFISCSLENIVIPDSVTKIGDSAFAGSCIETIAWPEGITEIPYGVFSDSKLSSITLPSSVTKIGPWAFSSTDISTIEIPSGVTEIGEYAFNSSKLTSITLPSGITEIADGTFGYCYRLTSIDIPDRVTRIGDYAFSQCHFLTSVRLPKNLARIGEQAFDHTAILSINIPKKLTHIGDSAFSGCHIIEIINEGNYTLSGLYAGSSDNGYLAYYAKEIHSGESKIFKVDDYLFYTYNNTNYLLTYTGSATEICLPESYNSQEYEIWKGAFRFRNKYCDEPIYSVIIPDCVTAIGDWAFYDCEDLKEIVIGKSVSSFGNQSLYSCYNLEKVYYKGTQTEWNEFWYVTNALRNIPCYYYSETVPSDKGNYWHYVNGVPTIWE